MIISIRVDDPRTRRTFRDPTLHMVLDQEVVETRPAMEVRTNPELRIIPCGLFWAIEQRDPRGGECFDADANCLGQVNTSKTIGQQLIPVLVATPQEPELLLYISVIRARRILRNKGENKYYIKIDEEAALLGDVRWWVDATRPMCYGGVNGEHACPVTPTRTLVYKKTHLNLCPTHIKRAEAVMASGRH